jgi:aspartyl-tRNA(Asn)/glutamyl-tRNA(Gln) amidotransferase subunit A
MEEAEGRGGCREVAARLTETDSIGLNATLDWSAALLDREAARVDAMPAPMPLHAMPIALKDNIVTIEQPSTCASKILEGYVSPFNATAVERLRAAGAMMACKANMDEFAMGSSTENSAFGRVKNPIDHSRVPGGSSGEVRGARGRRRGPVRSGPRPAARCASRRASAASSA